MKVTAAVKAGPAATTVLGAATRLAALLGATSEAVHVRVAGAGVPSAEAAAARVPLRLAAGPVTPGIVEAGRDPDVVALVLGAGGARETRARLDTALNVFGKLGKPVVVVPSREVGPWRFPRILVCLDETGAASAAVVGRACEAGADVVALYVFEEDSLPLFTDQAQHEFAAWSEELLARHCPGVAHAVRLEVRIGSQPQAVVAVARQTRPDVVVLGLDEELAPGQVGLAQTLLDTCGVPVALIPADASRPRELAADRGARETR